MNAVLNYPLGNPPAPGEVMEVVPGLHWLHMPLPLALDHINLWLLEDGDGWTVVDSGFGTRESKDVWERVFREDMGGRPLKRVVITHYHPDHIGLARWLSERFDVEVWMSRGEYDQAHLYMSMSDDEMTGNTATLFQRHGLSDDYAAIMKKRGNTYRKAVDGLPAAFNPLGEGDVITIGDRQWRVIIGRGHCPEHVCLYCREDGLLISGDQVLPRITSNISASPALPFSDPLAEFLDSLDKLDQLPADVRVMPSHGKVFEGLHPRIDYLRTHHRERLDALVEYCDEPRTAYDCLPVLFSRELDAHAMLFAMGESIAHLLHLEATGRVVRQTSDGDGIIRYQRASA